MAKVVNHIKVTRAELIDFYLHAHDLTVNIADLADIEDAERAVSEWLALNT